MNEIYKKLREIRVDRGFNTKKAASMLSITPQYLSRLENGKQKPSQNTLELMIQKYGLPYEDAQMLRAGFGYGTGLPSLELSQQTKTTPSPPEVSQPRLILNPKNTEIVFTNAAAISSDDFGIVIDAGQRVGSTNDIQIVSRIGFNLEHAEKIYEQLEVHIKKLKDSIKDQKKSL